jgi:hypothetical protein
MEASTSTFVDSSGRIKDEYRKSIRETFYQSGFLPGVEEWKEAYVEARRIRGTATFTDALGNVVPISQASIDHIKPVAQHWNEVGHDMTQEERLAWYNDSRNLRVVDRRKNSSLGSGGVSYSVLKVGPRFRGPNEV